ncbi:hypothetical protein CSKR_105547 [Clonorchis sinensis]|uniref:Uncharacterized protein n=1 Tax=Clonorchis sinensis TaxID=79923 RepID=A0A3R7G4P3_CLOSI|nr:hypothetical protein CSKR_105547 [Clonorchis sinensis]
MSYTFIHFVNPNLVLSQCITQLNCLFRIALQQDIARVQFKAKFTDLRCRSSVTPLRWSATLAPEGSTGAGILPGCPSLDRGSRETVVGFTDHPFIATIFEILRYMYIRNALLIRLLKILRQPTTGFALLGAHQMWCFSEYTHLQTNLVFRWSLTWNSTEILVYAVFKKLNVMHQAA